MKTLGFPARRRNPAALPWGLGGAGAAGVAVLLLLRGPGHAADHLDSETLAPLALADINDVYSWMSADGAKVNLVMTVSPNDAGRSFGAGVQYVFHVTSKPGAPDAVVAAPGGVESRVVCTFESNTSAQCWVVGANGVKDYVTGDPSNTAGITSTLGKLRLFAGRRSDPFFFNLQGFRDGAEYLRTEVVPDVDSDGASCPTLDTTEAPLLRTLLSSTRPTAAAPCPTNQRDCFASLNVLAIVLQVDKALLNATGNTYLSVWASTHAAPL